MHELRRRRVLHHCMAPSATSRRWALNYLSTMAMLVDREEDVHELRRRGVLDQQQLQQRRDAGLLQGPRPTPPPGLQLLEHLGGDHIDGYIRRRPVRITLHKFVYNNYRIIAAVLSIAGVLASILKALYSLKKP